MKKGNKEITVNELQKAMSIEIRPAEELKKPVAHPERFDFFMANALKKSSKKKTRK